MSLDSSSSVSPPPSSTTSDRFVLYSYWRSSCSYRVRIVLNLLNINYEYRSIHLLKSEQSSKEYLQINPSGIVPTLIIYPHANNSPPIVLTQSLAIIEYLVQTYHNSSVASSSTSQSQSSPSSPPSPIINIFPSDPFLQYHARSLSYIVACDIQPPANSRHLQQIQKLTQSEEIKNDWAKQIIENGLQAFETALNKYYQSQSQSNHQHHPTSLLSASTNNTNSNDNKYCLGNNTVTIADICLIPQLYNARRFNVNLSQYPHCSRIDEECQKLAAFQLALPEAQPDKV